MGYAFISYSTKNQDAANAMRELLKKNNIAVWMAPNDIPSGSKYAQVISHALKDCACLVLLLTNDSQNSTWVAKEVERAISHKKPIIPIKLEDIELNEEFEFYISTDQITAVQMIDDSSEEMIKVISSIKAITGIEAVKASPESATKFTKFTYPDGSVYEGEMLDGKKHGKGKMVFPNKAVYDGEWQDDKMNGRATLTMSVPETDVVAVYEGTWINNNQCGYGKMSCGGFVYEGEFSGSKFNGKGKVVALDGSVYEGDWVNGKKHGKGKMVYANGTVYEGEWKNDDRNGRGTATYTSGSVYEGEWIDGKKNGKGKNTFPNGSVYEGDFANDKIHGYGTMVYDDGSTYTGEWENNVPKK